MLKGVSYLVLVDRFTGWPLVKRLTKLDTGAIINVLEEWFFEYGKPVRLRSDNGPQFRSEFQDWCKKMDIVSELSSSYNHQANGAAECAVREMKKLLEKTDQNWNRFRRALREYRNTPRFDGLSPAQWLFGQRQRTDAVASPMTYARISDEQFKKHLELRGCMQDRVAEKFKSPRSKEQFHPGDKVVVQDHRTKRWSIEAVIVKSISKRSFRLTDGSREFTRNRKFLRKVPVAPNADQSALQLDNLINAQDGFTGAIQNQEEVQDQPGPMTRSRRKRRPTP